MCGTPNYIAPEVLAKKGHSTASEIWSVGCMVYALFCGSPPFETESVPSTYSRISSGQWSLPPKLSPEAVSFLQTMLAMEPALRTRVTKLLHHAFMLGPMPASLPPSAISAPPVFQGDSSREESPSEFLHSVIIELEHCLESSSSSRGSEAGTVLPNYVAKWLDYSNRLGFGYQLCDGSTGVSFVDGSRIRSDPGQDRVTCTDRLAREGTGEVMLEGERSRRLQLLGFFRRYLSSLLPRPALHRESQGGWAEAELVAWRRDEEHVTMQVSEGANTGHSDIPCCCRCPMGCCRCTAWPWLATTWCGGSRASSASASSHLAAGRHTGWWHPAAATSSPSSRTQCCPRPGLWQGSQVPAYSVPQKLDVPLAELY